MDKTQEILSEWNGRRPWATPLARLSSPVAAVTVLLDALVARLVRQGHFGWEEWQAKLTHVWQRDFAEIAQTLWERLGAAEEGRLCQEECGARCCHSACLILSPQEAAGLQQRGRELGVEVGILDHQGRAELGDADPMAGPGWMLPAYPCPFLSRDKLCRVYPDRPLHCQRHPTYWREDCSLSQRWYFKESGIARQPLAGPSTELLERLARLARPDLRSGLPEAL